MRAPRPALAAARPPSPGSPPTAARLARPMPLALERFRAAPGQRREAFLDLAWLYVYRAEGQVHATMGDKVAAVEAFFEEFDADPARVRRLCGWAWIRPPARRSPDHEKAAGSHGNGIRQNLEVWMVY